MLTLPSPSPSSLLQQRKGDSRGMCSIWRRAGSLVDWSSPSSGLSFCSAWDRTKCGKTTYQKQLSINCLIFPPSSFRPPSILPSLPPTSFPLFIPLYPSISSLPPSHLSFPTSRPFLVLPEISLPLINRICKFGNMWVTSAALVFAIIPLLCWVGYKVYWQMHCDVPEHCAGIL